MVKVMYEHHMCLVKPLIHLNLTLSLSIISYYNPVNIILFFFIFIQNLFNTI